MKRLICLGGSITAADRLFCSDSLGEGYVSMLPPLLPDFQILNKGIDGFTIARILQNVDRDCINLHPDFVTIHRYGGDRAGKRVDGRGHKHEKYLGP